MRAVSTAPSVSPKFARIMDAAGGRGAARRSRREPLRNFLNPSTFAALLEATLGTVENPSDQVKTMDRIQDKQLAAPAKSRFARASRVAPRGRKARVAIAAAALLALGAGGYFGWSAWGGSDETARYTTTV